MGEGNELLRVTHISKTFPGTRALTDVSMSLKAGEVKALVGENGAGKSTLMNIIGGVLQRDAGQGGVYINGEPADFKTPADAISAGIGFVHQELSLFSHLPVSYNIFVDRLPMTKWNTIDKKKLREDAQKLLDSFTLPISPDIAVGKLTVGNQQIVEIIHAVALNAKIMIFDEPTSSLSESEVEILFEIIEKLRKNGVGVIYITHKLSEIFRICDTVSVLRDGRIVSEFEVSKTTTQELVNNMVGREIGDYYVEKSSGIGEEIFRVENLRIKSTDIPISFSLKKNEILGFYGLVGAGRSELLRAACGIDRRFSGEIYLYGKQIKVRNYQDALKNGITYLTEDRKKLGIFPGLSVMQNIYVSDMCRKGGVMLNNGAEYEDAKKSVVENNVKTSSVEESIMNLSGGNQQKAIIARCLKINPQIIILDEPTRGVDVNAKAEIHKKIRALAEQGMGVIVISSEMPEIMGLCDEINIMYEGKLTGKVCEDDICEQKIIQYATEVYDKAI